MGSKDKPRKEARKPKKNKEPKKDKALTKLVAVRMYVCT